MKKYVYLLLAMAACLSSCQEKEEVFDPYSDWTARNAQWFEDTVQVARAAIAQAKAQHGEEWEEHCPWRMYKSTFKSTTSTGPVTDSICVRIIENHLEGTEDYAAAIAKGSPVSNDTVRVNFRGWLMPTENYKGDGTAATELTQKVFTTTYYGDYDPLVASPQLMAIGNLVEGFSTALQYMHEGDDWMVFIPQELAYGSSSQGSVPAYSTLQFRIHMLRWYESGTGIE